MVFVTTFTILDCSEVEDNRCVGEQEEVIDLFLSWYIGKLSYDF
jgi:hypothetical protein